LSDQRIGPGLEGLYGIATSSKPERRFFESAKMHDCICELSRIALRVLRLSFEEGPADEDPHT